MAVWLCQCLCPDRHCIMAAAHEAKTHAEADALITVGLREQLEGMIAEGTMNPRCGLCGASDATWRYELARTRFATMAEALPWLIELERANQEAADRFGDIHETQRPN
jgi:hypothetical protein